MMKLMYAATSPYVRKVMIVARELDLLDRLELVPASASPIKANPTLAALNPIAKVPTLVTEDGLSLFDSPVVCEYLSALAPAKGIFPAGSARWVALRDQALADGLLDAALLSRYELLRPETERSTPWTEGQMAKIIGALDAMEAHTSQYADRLDIGTITVACALGYLDFRFDTMGWRDTRPALAAWFESFRTRPAFVATQPTV